MFRDLGKSFNIISVEGIIGKGKSKVKQSHYRPGQALRIPGV
jgi:hypothetical protein